MITVVCKRLVAESFFLSAVRLIGYMTTFTQNGSCFKLLGFDGGSKGGTNWTMFATWKSEARCGWWSPPQAGVLSDGAISSDTSSVTFFWHAGPSWGNLGTILEPFWGSQPTSMKILVPGGSVLRVCWAIFEPSCSHPGAILGFPGDRNHDARAWKLRFGGVLVILGPS